MGLNEQERIEGLYANINKMVGFADEINKKNKYRPDYDPFNKIVDLVNNLWNSFIGSNSNQAHWLLGSSATNVIGEDENTAWTIAIRNTIEDALHDLEIDNTIYPDDIKVEDIRENFLSISPLLEKLNYTENLARVYDIYAYSEQLTYYLRRYNDETAKKLETLSKLISDIQGECFNIFSNSTYKDDFVKAYILSQICNLLFDNKYPYNEKDWDIPTKIIANMHMYHHLSNPMKNNNITLKDLAIIHKDLVKAKNTKKFIFNVKRLQYIIKLCGKSMHYKHEHDSILNMIKKTPYNQYKKIFVEEFKKCIKLHDEKEKEDQDEYNREEKQLQVYGWNRKD
ncbi:MAG: hypothetical protein AABY32_01755 [Nanoarchaeota archaeon]